MKRLFLFIFVIVVFSGCADDIIIPKASELRGVYEGLYERITGWEDGIPGQSREYQYIQWTFSDQKMWMKAIRLTDKEQFACDFNGFYEVKDRIVFTDLVTTDVCNMDMLPTGEFIKDTKPGSGDEDSLILEQPDMENYIFKSIRIVKTE